MGPDADCLELARELKKEFPQSITTDEYTLAYSIQAWLEKKEAEDAKASATPPHQGD